MASAPPQLTQHRIAIRTVVRSIIANATLRR